MRHPFQTTHLRRRPCRPLGFYAIRRCATRVVSRGRARAHTRAAFEAGRTFLVAGYLLAGLLAGTVFVAAEASAAPRHLRVTWIEQPDREAIISWTTDNEGASNVLDVWADGESTAPQSHKSRSGAYEEGGPWWHHVNLTNLKPSTTYHLRASADGDWTPTVHFITAPSDDRAFRLLVGGDSRTGLAERKKINRMMAGLFVKHPDIVALAHGGDYIVSGNRWELWEKWLTDHELTNTPAGRLLPVIPARGNHDGGEHYTRVFGIDASHPKAYFTTELGSELALLTLNTSTETATGSQRDWLALELENRRPAHRWLLAQYHRPMYPAYKSPAGAKTAWVPLFERHNLDLALEADGHNIKRTVPIRNERHDPSGVIYIGEGGLGVPQRIPKPGRWYLDAPGMSSHGHNVTVLHVQPEKIDYEVLRLEGGVADEYTLAPRSDRTAKHTGADAIAGGAKAADPAKPEPGTLVARGAEWRYLAANQEPAGWAAAGFDDRAWPAGPGGFGYGDDDDKTVVEMEDKHRGLFIRTGFELEKPVNKLTLHLRFDDSFIAYINGREVARQGVSGEKPKGKLKVKSHEARGEDSFVLEDLSEVLVAGQNTLAIAGYNVKVSSSDLTLDPRLVEKK